MKLTEISKIMGKQWQEMSDQQKKPFYDLQDKEKKRYNTQLDQISK